MRAEEQKGIAETLLAQSGEISALLRSYDWSQTPLGEIETWSESLKTAVQSQLTEFAQSQIPKKAQQKSALPPQDCTQTAALHQAGAFRVTLADALRLLIDANEIQATAARILGEQLGASRVIYAEVLPDGKNVIVHQNYTNGVAELSGQYHLDEFGRNMVADHQAGQTAIVPDVANSPKHTDSEKAMYRAINIAAHLDVPLIKKDQFVALLAVHQATPRHWTEHEVKWVEETAEQTWAAVQRARAEAALRESEERFRNMADNAPGIVWVTDPAGSCTYLSQRWYDFTGQTEETGLGFGWLTRVHPDDSEMAERIFLHANERREAFQLEYRLQNKQGEYIWAIDAASPWFGVDGQFKGYIGSVLDISDRKKTEAVLQESEELKRRILESSKDCIKVLTLEGQLLYLSKGGLHLLEIDDLSSVLNTQWLDFWQGEHYQSAQAALAVAKAGNVGQFQGYAPTIKGTLKWWDVIVTPIRDASGRVAQLLSISRDITKQKQAESEQEQLLKREQAAREEAERANRIKDEFLAVLSHELRSPLNPILGWTRLLRNGKLDPVRQTDALATIERNAKLQSQLIEDLLDISRIMQGKLTLSATPVSLAFVIAAAVETVSLAADAKHIQITLDLDPEVAPVSGDAARLQQVVWNLLSNAIKFTDPGGQVKVELRRVAAAGNLGNAMAQIRVIDTGKGISPQFLPSVFEYFRQEDASTTRKFGGLGLGLAIVRQIVELHGGTVKAESRGEHQGATFIVQLPTLQQAVPIDLEPTQVQANLAMRLQNVQILLVDDDTDTREFEAFLLEQYGATVIAAASGSEALQALDRSLPDVIVSDIGMAEIDGYLLMQQIRSRPPAQGGTIPAISLTAYAAEIDQKKALQSGYQKYLTKPLEPEQLVSAIVTLLKPNRV